jgi:hypothetical protein
LSNEPNNREHQLDAATAARLRKLASLPMDTSRLDAMVQSRIPQPKRSSRWRILRPMTAIAASLTLLIGIAAAVLLSTSGGEVLASPTQMVQLHRDIVANRIAVTKVGSIEEAGKVLSQQSGSQSPQLPDAPEAHVMACCMKSIKSKKMACVLLQSAGTPITMSVARSEDIKTPACPAIERNGASYHVHSADGLNMVMTERAGRWVCLMSELPQDQLIDLASRLRF